MKLTVKCWKSQALMILVATLGKMPRFFCLFELARSSESSSAVPSPDPTLLSNPSPKIVINKCKSLYISKQ